MTLPGALAQELEGWRKSCHAVRPADFVFPSATGTAVSEHNYERDVLVPAESEAGIMPPRVQGQAYRRDKAAAVNFQSLRRTFATWMQKTGATVKDVQAAMRHSTPDHPIRTYVKEIPESVKRVCAWPCRTLTQCSLLLPRAEYSNFLWPRIGGGTAIIFRPALRHLFCSCTTSMKH